jgi:type IV pilus assembly protein PilM
MEILQKTLGSRPRLAVELRPEGIVAAKAEDATAVLTAVAQAPLPDGVFAIGLKAGNFIDRVGVVAGLREALDAVAGRANDRNRNVTIIVPDATVRVLLLEFDTLPTKPVEALAVVRFRLKKLLPFDSDHAAVSYQIMSSEKSSVRVLAVAMPREVLEEYESIVAEAGYRPGAVIPSTLAALAGLDEQQSAVLIVNAGQGGITTAIVRAGVLLLHRSLELENEVSASEEMGGQDLRSGMGYESTIQARVLASVEAAMTGREIAQAVNVAAAYFEDNLGHAPEVIFSAGPLGAEGLRATLEENGFERSGVRELIKAEALAASVATSRVQLSWLAGVRGALKG